MSGLASLTPFPANTYMGRYGMGLMHFLPFGGHQPSAPPAPHLADMRLAIERFYKGDFVSLLVQERPVYVSDPGLHRRWQVAEHELVILLVVCITCTALAYMVGERLLLRAGLLAHAPVFSKDELAHTYDATVAQYDAWISSATHSHGWLTPLRSQVAAYVHATFLHLRARIAHALRRRTPTHSQRV